MRSQLKLTQEKLAQELGVSVMTIRRWEANKHKPSSLALRQIEQLQKNKEEKDVNKSATQSN